MTKQDSEEIYWMYDTVVPIGEGKYESIQPVNNNNNNNNNNNDNFFNKNIIIIIIIIIINNNNSNSNNSNFIGLLTQITGKLLSVSS